MAEDISQEVFLKFWDKMDTIQSGKEKSYLYTTAKHMIINTRQHEKVVLKFEMQLTEKKVHDTPHFKLELKEFKTALEKAISELPDTQREVFLMHRLNGLKYREISELLEISQKAVEKRMTKALFTLRNFYKNI
jgi:RNA polymerase sigma-70 factor (ECF subfamily)